MFSLSGLLTFYFFFEVPLWLIVSRGCNKERRILVKLFCLRAAIISVV